MKYGNVLITGASGRLGRFVLDEIAPHADVGVLDLAKPHADVPWVEGNVTDIDTVRRAVAGRDAVVHLAAIDIGRPAQPEQYFNVNVTGTWNVLQAAHEAGIDKVVIASSISANGTGEMRPNFPPAYLPIDELHPCRPVHPYGVGKMVIEDVARSFTHRGGMRVVCLRPTAVVVPSHLPKVIERSRDRNQRWLAAYVTGADTARAFRLALDYEDAAFDAMFVTAADSATDEPTLERARRLFGHLPALRDPARYAHDPCASMVDAGRARECLGWEPTTRWPDLVRAFEAG